MNGVLLVNKEKGISSFGVCSKVRKKLGIKKVGHSGTLDPEAEGLLTILIGEGTKLSKYLVEHSKEYKACLKIGIKTDSADGEGNIIKKDSFKLRKEDEEKYKILIKSFEGEIKQVPPMYSALKVNGKKLYEYARSGQEIERKARDIQIFSIIINELNYDENEIYFTVNCSKGTYIRTLCEQIAEKLGTVGYMKSLVRTKVNEFKIEDAFSLEQIEMMTVEDINSRIITIEKLFEKSERLDMTKKGVELLKNGVLLTYKLPDGEYRIYSNGIFIGIGKVEKQLLKRDIIL